MKKNQFIFNLLFLALTSVACTAQLPTGLSLELPENPSLPEAYRQMLPASYEIPDQLPDSIQDPYLLTAWVYLYNQTETITVNESLVYSGRSLAEYVIQRNVPIHWGSPEICNGNSCARLDICNDLDCVAHYNTTTVYPVYISTRYQDTTQFTLARLAGSLAHELFHHTLPFGPVGTTLYGEYWAYYVGARIEKARWVIFTGYQPMQLACLKAWFRVNGLTDYFGAAEYPFTLTTQPDLTSEVCGS